jgi:hypothetical protein
VECKQERGAHSNSIFEFGFRSDAVDLMRTGGLDFNSVRIKAQSVWRLAAQPTIRRSIPGSGKRLVSWPQQPDWLAGAPILMSSEYRGHFPKWTERPGREADLSHIKCNASDSWRVAY